MIVADQTLTETEVDPRKLARSRRACPGVVVPYCRGAHPWLASPVESTRTVGRDPSAELTVADAGVSRVHVRLERRGPGLLVTDLGSRNGTWLNGVRVPAEGAAAPAGSVIRMAQTILVVVNDATPYLQSNSLNAAGLIGGACLDEVRNIIGTFAASNRPALVLGPTGTGKEIVARALHEASGRMGQFVALNCAAVPAELIDAEMFGHTRGAFSNAVGARSGLFKTADGGTLFLDELGELPAAAQAKLLRTLESGEVRAVGSDSAQHVDVRVVGATNRDLDEMAAADGFRADLLHRVAGLRIVLPPLAERIEDVPSLVHHFSGSVLPITAQALEHLMLQPWPGNVRELRNVVLSAIEVARRRDHSEIELSDIAAVTTAHTGSRTTRKTPDSRTASNAL